MENVNITINGKKLSVPDNYTVLEAAKEANIKIPTLCFLKGFNEIGACRMCLVEIKGARALQASCVYPVSDGLEVFTNTPAVRRARRSNLELILSNHEKKCLTCVRNHSCELQTLSEELNITEIPFEGVNNHYEIDNASPSIVRDNNKCVLCRRCVSVCEKSQSTAVIQAKGRGFTTSIGSIYDKSLNDVGCIMCGQCINACPVGALYEKSHIDRVWDAIKNPNLKVIVQTAPGVRAALGEEFGLPMGTSVTGKMVAAIKELGVDNVFDTNTGADLTIMEEGNEFLHRLKNGGVLPMITSCSPGWIKFCENYFPEFIPNLSSCKSPHTMFGAMLKSYYAKKQGIDPKDMFVVSVMPCIAKKYEIARPEMEVNGIRDVDAVLTTRELAKMIKQVSVDFVNLPEVEFDNPIGEASGAAVIFGTTGGVMEAALRTVAEIIKGSPLEEVDINVVRGPEGIKEFEIPLPGITLKGAVVSGTGNARRLMNKIKAGEAEYHFIEVMGCPGGCVTGGGQPIVDATTRRSVDVFGLRASALYGEDRDSSFRVSHKNPYVKAFYDEYAGEPNGHIAHELLHTTYVAKEKFPEDLLERKSYGFVEK